MREVGLYGAGGCDAAADEGFLLQFRPAHIRHVRKHFCAAANQGNRPARTGDVDAL
jgi:hypothetical protein